VPENPLAEAYVRTLLGQRDSAIELLKTYLQSLPYARGQVAHSPWFSGLASDPRFKALVEPPV
jgi:hypothetical protein